MAQTPETLIIHVTVGIKKGCYVSTGCRGKDIVYCYDNAEFLYLCETLKHKSHSF
jgi:hypothetical protein